MTGNNLKGEVLTGPERRRRWAAAEKLAMVAETYEAGATVSLVARRHGVAPNQLFTWRRLAAQGTLTAAEAGEEVVPASDYRALQAQVRELQRLLGKKTLESVWRDVLSDGFSCGLHRIERLMRSQTLRARPRRRGLPKDQGERLTAAIAANLLDRQFKAERPNQKWIADFTYIWTAEGWLYVAAVMDLFSRRVVGWSMQAQMTAGLVADAS